MDHIPIAPLKCNNCNKKYNRLSAYKKHKLLCCERDPHTPKTTLNCGGDPHTPKTTLNCERDPHTPKTTLNCEENTSTSTQSEVGRLGSPPLRDIVMELVKSNNKLRKDVEELKRWVYAKKKKIIIVDWLNENYKPVENYKEFISKLNIRREHLDIIFKSNIIDGIQEILQNFIVNNDICPLKSLDQRVNTIYVYNEDSKWEQLSLIEFNNIISNIMKRILDEFKKWQDENEDKLYTDDFSAIYVQNVKKVMGGDISIDKQRSKIHRNLYTYLKMNLQNTIEYEFCG